jgi:ssDNA-specific exonuclease RecJ
LDLWNKLEIKEAGITASQILFCICVFMELNFIEFDDILNKMEILKSKKAEITSSLIYKKVMEG